MFVGKQKEFAKVCGDGDLLQSETRQTYANSLNMEWDVNKTVETTIIICHLYVAPLSDGFINVLFLIPSP